MASHRTRVEEGAAKRQGVKEVSDTRWEKEGYRWQSGRIDRIDNGSVDELALGMSHMSLDQSTCRVQSGPAGARIYLETGSILVPHRILDRAKALKK
jgi:hypothetical protein